VKEIKIEVIGGYNEELEEEIKSLIPEAQIIREFNLVGVW